MASDNASSIISLPPASPETAIDSGERLNTLTNRLLTQKDALLSSLTDVDTYLQLIFIGITIVVAKLIATAVVKRIKAALKKRPIRHLDPEFVSKPLSLLAPTLAFFILVFGKIGFEIVDVGSRWIDAALQMTVAYIMARSVLLVVHNRAVAKFIAWVIMIVAAIKAMRFMRSLTAYLDSLSFDAGNFHVSLLSILHGFVVLVVVFWIATALSQTLESYLRRSSALSYNAREIAVKCFKLFVYFIALFITLNAMGIDLTAFAVFGGALGVGIGLGLQKLTSNFVSSVTLLVEKSIKIGDLIEVGGYTGWVRKLNVRYALLETFDGREVMIPNEVMVSTNLTNWTHTNTDAQIEIKVAVGYDNDAVAVRELILQAASEHPRCVKKPAPACVIKEFTDNGITFILTFWIADVREGRSGPQSEVMFSLLKKFADAGIDMPRPPAAAPLPAPKSPPV